MCDVGLQQPSKPRNQNRTIVLHQPPGLEITDHEITNHEVREVNYLVYTGLLSIYSMVKNNLFVLTYDPIFSQKQKHRYFLIFYNARPIPRDVREGSVLSTVKGTYRYVLFCREYDTVLRTGIQYTAILYVQKAMMCGEKTTTPNPFTSVHTS